MADNEVRMMMSVVPGAMTGFAALNAGLVSINNVFGAMTRSIDAQFGLINTAIMTTGVVVAQLGANAMDAFGQFEQGMKIVQMVSGQTSSDIDLLKNKANEFSIQYRMDIDQLTEGLQTLGRAGLNSASEQAEVLENGLYTAKLEGRDLKGVLEELIQTTALLGGDLKSSDFGEQSGYVENLMVATSMTAPITTHDVNETLKYSGGIAAAAGANINSEEGKRILEDYMGSIAAFAQKGVTGSIAGTALRAFFNKPATQDSSVKEALSSINLTPESLWEDDEQTMKPVSEQIGLIQDQMDKLHISTMDRLQIWSKIVGGKMGQQMMKLNSDDIKELTADIRSADNASSLAANSMKTYEANLKAIGETGASLERNVGQRLVFFANPIIEVLNKVASFLNNDVTASILAISIISFITIAGKKAIDVVRAVKAEISTLYAGMKAQQQFFTQKQGVVRVGDNSLERESIEKYKAYFKAKDEYYGTSRDGKNSSGEKVSSPTSLKDFSKQFSSTFKHSGALTLKSFQEAGISAEKTALAGHLMGLTSAKNSLELPEGRIWAAALKNNLISPEQFNKMFTAYGAGVNARPTADLIGIESVIPQIKACEQALRDLGIAATQAVQPSITAEDEKAAAEMFAAEAINTTKQEITEEEVYRNTLNNKIRETRDAITQEIYEEGLFEQTIRKESQAAVDAAIKTDVMAEQVILDFNRMSAAVSASTSNLAVNIPNRMHPKTSVYGSLYQIPQYFNSSKFFGDPYHGMPKLYTGHYDSLSPLYKEWMKSGLGRAFGYNLSDDKMAHYLAANRIPGYLNMSEKAQEIHRNNIKTYPDIGRNSVMPIYGPASPEGIKQWKQIQENVKKGLGGGVGNIPGEKEKLRTHEDQRKEYEDKKAKLVQQARNEYSEKDAASTKALQQHQENVKKQNLSNVQYGEDSLNIDRQRLAIEEEILVSARTRAESQGVSSSGMHGKGVPQSEAERFRKEAASGRQKTGDTLGRAGYSSKSSPDQVVDKNFGKNFTGFREARASMIKQQMEQNSEHSKLLNKVNEIAQRNKNLSSTYMEGIAQNKKHMTLFTQLNKGYKGEPYYVNPGGRIVYDNMYTEKGAVGVVGPYTPINPLAFSGTSSNENLKKQGGGFGSAFAKNFSERLNRDRTGSFLSFGSTEVNGVTRSATKGLSGLANKALNATDAVGGPFMIAIMAVTTAIQMWQKAFQDYCEDLKEAGDKLSDAYSKLDSADSDLEKTFKKGNPDAEQEEIDQMMYDTYEEMGNTMARALTMSENDYLSKLGRDTETGPKYEYDEEAADGTMKQAEEEELTEEESYEKAIKENTGALYAAAHEVSAALNNYTRIAQDSWWGSDGWTGWVTDQFGGFMDKITHSETGGSTFSGNNNEFLLTQSQADENYSGYKEMAGLILEDFKDANGQWLEGMKTMMGEDAEQLSKALSPSTKTYLTDMAKFASGKGIGGLSSAQNAKLQQSMKNDPKTWKKLGKELAKRDTNKKLGKDITKNQNRIRGLTERIRSTVGKGFKDAQIQRAAYIQQLQDMKQIADQAMVPIMQTNLGIAGQTLSATGNINQNTGNTVNTTGSTNENAAIIAGLVAIIARQSAKAQHFDDVLAGGEEGDNDYDGNPGTEADKQLYRLATQDGMNADKFYQENMKNYNSARQLYNEIGSFGGVGNKPIWERGGLFVNTEDEMAGALGYTRLIEATAKMTAYDYDKTKAKDEARAFADEVKGKNLSDIFGTVDKNYTQSEEYKDKIVNSYLSANDDDDNNSGSGGGGGDSGDKDNTGTKKERVDLVLCSKKEIPKLNVNLFKKPPTFTVLNKNFKVRDVKINTEDTPKAIMSSIKNAFIDVQKRSDPKIIQDEDAVYDPEGATDGNPLPSGTAKTRTSE